MSSAWVPKGSPPMGSLGLPRVPSRGIPWAPKGSPPMGGSGTPSHGIPWAPKGPLPWGPTPPHPIPMPIPASPNRKSSFWEVLTRQKCADTNMRNFLPPASRNLASGSIRKLDFHDVGVAGESHFITEWSQILPFCPRPRKHKLLFSIFASSSND